MSTLPTQLGPYPIEREIGRGGMGVVYRGRDTKLDRPVAIKTLPEELAHDPARLARFEREARTLAQLSHANVAGIYGVEEDQGQRYLVLEYVEGETLAERLDRGPLPIDEALELAIQIASGVEAAHEAGIIHRDLKPANIKITSEGGVKVLDFGLAKADDGASTTGSSLSQSPTLTSPAMPHSPTLAGAILGTAAYMSPEQARGRKVDKRTDIWSFGVILYECLVGASPFVGESVSDSIGAVLHKTIDLTQLPTSTPAGVARVLRRCVERDKEMRYRDIGDVRVELLRSAEETDDAALAPNRTSGRGWMALVSVMLAIVVGGGWLWTVVSRPVEDRATRRFDLVVEHQGLDLFQSEPRVSPDGTHVAYLVGKKIHLRSLSSFESRTLPDTEGALRVFWSPDGQWLGYVTEQAVFKRSVTGGSAIKLTDERMALSTVAGGGWTDDGRLIVTDDRRGLMSVPAGGGDPESLLAVDDELSIDYHDPSVIPDTGVILYIDHLRDFSCVVKAFDGDRSVQVAAMDQTMLGNPVYSPTGHVLFTRGWRNGSVWAVAFDPGTLQAQGEPFLVESEGANPSVAQDGTLILLRGDTTMGGVLAWVGRDGEIDPVVSEFETAMNPRLSPDETKLAFAAGPASRIDIWMRELGRDVNRRITFEEQFAAVSAWSPDGLEIAIGVFRPNRDVVSATEFLFADGSGVSRPAVEGLMISFDHDWESAVLVTDPMRDEEKLFAVELADLDERAPLPLTYTMFFQSALNPEGTILAYTSSETGRKEVFCTRFPSGRGKWQVSTSGGTSPVWSRDGATLYFATDENILYESTVTTEPSFSVGAPSLVLDGARLGLELSSGWDVASDDERFIVVTSKTDDQSQPASIAAIQNWYEEHRAR